MHSERQFLNRIRLATGRGEAAPRRTGGSGGDEAVRAVIRGRTVDEQLQLLAALKCNAIPLKLQVQAVATLDEAAVSIARIAQERTPEFHQEMAIIRHDHPLLHALPLDQALAGTGIPVHVAAAADPMVRNNTLASSIGITVADWAVAESATIVQRTGPGKPRSTSLVPSIHIALLELSSLLAELGEAYTMLRSDPRPGSLVFISGPSKTADIEAVMVHGAHGPREMHLLVLTSRERADAAQY